MQNVCTYVTNSRCGDSTQFQVPVRPSAVFLKESYSHEHFQTNNFCAGAASGRKASGITKSEIHTNIFRPTISDLVIHKLSDKQLTVCAERAAN